MISMNMLSTTSDKSLKAQHHLMEISFLVLQSFDEVNEVAVECVTVFTTYMNNKYFTHGFKPQSDVSVPMDLKHIVECLDEMLQSPQFKEIVNESLHHHFLEGIIAHFFPEKSESESPYCKEDVEYFIIFVSKQTTWKDSLHKRPPPKQSDLLMYNCISISKFKFHLNKILCKGWNNSDKNLGLYKLEVCSCIGETILQCCPEATPSEYIPPYLQSTNRNKNPLMQQMLTHLYFYTVLEKLQACKYAPSSFLTSIRETEKKLVEAASNADKIILYVEKQALIEVLLEAVVNKFEEDDANKLTSLLAISDDINNLIKKQLHCDVLWILLLKKCHGPQGVLNLLSDKNRRWWENFASFVSIKDQLEKSPPPTSHLFPFTVGGPNAKCHFSMQYQAVSKHLHSIADDSTPSNTSAFLNYVNSVGDTRYAGKRSIRMMIWLVVYHKFYCNRRKSPELIFLFESKRNELQLSLEHLNVLRCFLCPSNMLKQNEIPNPLNPNDEVLKITSKGAIIRKEVSGDVKKRDAIWEFFDPENLQEDTDLRHALANLIAVVFRLRDGDTHIWYHIFHPDELENTYLTGFMYPHKVKQDGLMYDCGCELNEDGQYGRKDYIPHATRGTLSLHSLYLLLWTNFGAFCVGLITQPNTYEKLNGKILSDWMSIRDYCMTQLRTVWFHMRTNLGLSDEERSFFVMRSMHRLFMLFQEDAFPCPGGKFVNSEARDFYEKTWHTQIYEPCKANLQIELKSHSSQSVWALPVMERCRALDQKYPHFITFHDYTKSLVAAREACNFDPAKLFILQHFTLEYDRLQMGGALLPDLVEFYQWIHTHLSHLVTYELAEEITIGNVIELTAKRYSQETCDYLTHLFDRIAAKFNKYLDVNGGVVSEVTCTRALKDSDVHHISDETPLIRLVSQEKATTNDWLYIVLRDIVDNHNSFLQSVFSNATSLHHKYLSDHPPELQPTEFRHQDCVIPFNEADDKHQFMKLINSCSSSGYSDTSSTQMFDLDQLEQDVVAFYISGKPFIKLGNIRTTFRFRNSPNGENTLRNSPACAIDLSAIAQELPSDYKEQLQMTTREKLVYHFHDAKYHSFNEIVTGLRTALGYLSQDNVISNESSISALNMKLVDYLKQHFQKDQPVFKYIGIYSVNDEQLTVLGDIELKRLFKCIELFVDWLQGGFYDFSKLPISVFRHMKDEDLKALDNISSNKELTAERLLKELDEFEKNLIDAEHHLTTHTESRKSIIETLDELAIFEKDDKFVHLVPKTILLCHYVELRMALRKLKTKITKFQVQITTSITSVSVKWTENIKDLLKYLPKIQKEEELYDDNCLKLDCIKLQFVDGDDEESDNDSETWPHHGASIVDSADSYTPNRVSTTKSENIKKTDKQSSLPPESVTSPSQSSVLSVEPQPQAIGMTTSELCEWLKAMQVKDKHIKCFEDEGIDGVALAAFDDGDLEELGIDKGYVRKKIMAQFRQIK